MPDLCDISSECADKEFKAHISSIQSQLNITYTALSEDMYGNKLCVDCDSVIPPNRLKAMPNTIRCITCQQIYEDGLQ